MLLPSLITLTLPLRSKDSSTGVYIILINKNLAKGQDIYTKNEEMLKKQ
jgi:hypothetical protein